MIAIITTTKYRGSTRASSMTITIMTINTTTTKITIMTIITNMSMNINHHQN